MRIAIRCRIDTHADKYPAAPSHTTALESKGALFLVKGFKTIGILSKIERDKCLACSVSVRIIRHADQVLDFLLPHTNPKFRKLAVLRRRTDNFTIDLADTDLLDGAAIGS